MTVKTSAGDLTFADVKDGTARTAILSMPAKDVTITGVTAKVHTPKLAVEAASVAGNKMTIKFNTALETDLAKADFTEQGSDTIAAVDFVGESGVKHDTFVITFNAALTAGTSKVQLNANTAISAAENTHKVDVNTMFTLNANGTVTW